MNQDRNIAYFLSRMAAEHPNLPALTCPGGSMTYRQLDEASDSCALGLELNSIQRGTRTVLMVKPGLELITLAFALIKIGAVPVLIDPGMGWRNLGKCLAEARPAAFIGIPLAQAARALFGWGRPTIKTLVTVGGGPRLWGGKRYSDLLEAGSGERFEPRTIPLDELAAIVFTSGSTGVPKGVAYTHRMFAAQARLLKENFNIKAGEVDLATFPLFALFDPALEMTTVFPKMDFTRPGKVDPLEIISAVNRNGVTHMFGSPALLDRVSRHCQQHNVKLPTIRRVLSAGAPVPQRVIDRVVQMIPKEALLHTPYGATEALPVCSISHREIAELQGESPEKGVCVGHPLKGVGLDLIPISDEPVSGWDAVVPVEPGTVGEIVVWGDNVSREYFERPEATAVAKIRMPDGSVRHRMGDLGLRDELGRIWFCGRKSHRVITQSETLFTVPCEKVFNQHPKVYRSALVGVGETERRIPVICVELEKSGPEIDWQELKADLERLAQKYSHTRQIKTFLLHPAFPVDIRHNAKIFREKLAVWAAKELG